MSEPTTTKSNFDYPPNSAICWDGEGYWSEHDFSQGNTCTRCGEKLEYESEDDDAGN